MVCFVYKSLRSYIICAVHPIIEAAQKNITQMSEIVIIILSNKTQQHSKSLLLLELKLYKVCSTNSLRMHRCVFKIPISCVCCSTVDKEERDSGAYGKFVSTSIQKRNDRNYAEKKFIRRENNKNPNGASISNVERRASM